MTYFKKVLKLKSLVPLLMSYGMLTIKSKLYFDSKSKVPKSTEIIKNNIYIAAALNSL